MNKKMALLAAVAALVLAGTEVAVYALTGDLRVTGELRADGDFVAPARSVNATELATESVTTDKLAPAAVFTTAIREDAITTGKISAGAVTTSKQHLDLPSARVLCVTSSKRMGTCSNLADANGGCTCS